MTKVTFSLKETVKQYMNGGNILIIATILALLCANLPGIREVYSAIWEMPVRLQIGDYNLFDHHGHPMTLLAFINDTLMVIFFFVVGLEIKREVLVGELSSLKKAMLPIIGAVGGMIVPVAIFFALGWGSDYLDGAAIPMATDIAFSLGVLAMLGSRVPISLKVFLTTLAVADDIGGIIIIALFYSSHIDYMALVYAAILLVALFVVAKKFQIQSKLFYLVIGTIIWVFFLQSGIHPTIAGVLIAFCIPATPRKEPNSYIKTIRDRIALFPVKSDAELETKTLLNNEQLDWIKEIENASDKIISPLQELEDNLHPLVTYFIIPLFAFSNAGIFLGDMTIMSVFEGVTLAIFLALFIGKFAGILLFSWASIKLKITPMPNMSNFKMLASVAMLGGIGFTVSLFIASLSYGEGMEVTLNNAKLGIILGSLFSGFVGYFMLNKTMPKEPCNDNDEL